MDVHVLTPRGAELVVQVVDGQVIVPSAPAVAGITPAQKSFPQNAPRSSVFIVRSGRRKTVVCGMNIEVKPLIFNDLD